MLFLNEQLLIIAMGVFVSYFARLFKIHPIPLGREIMGYMIGLGIIWLIYQVNAEFYSVSFSEYCRFLLLGYLPGRIIWRRKKRKDE